MSKPCIHADVSLLLLLLRCCCCIAAAAARLPWRRLADAWADAGPIYPGDYSATAQLVAVGPSQAAVLNCAQTLLSVLRLWHACTCCTFKSDSMPRALTAVTHVNAPLVQPYPRWHTGWHMVWHAAYHRFAANAIVACCTVAFAWWGACDILKNARPMRTTQTVVACTHRWAMCIGFCQHWSCNCAGADQSCYAYVLDPMPAADFASASLSFQHGKPVFCHIEQGLLGE